MQVFFDELIAYQCLKWLAYYLMLFFGMQSTFCTANLQSRVKKGKMSQEKFEKTLSLVTGVLSYDDFKSVDLVIEVGKGHYLGLQGSVFRKYESAFSIKVLGFPHFWY